MLDAAGGWQGKIAVDVAFATCLSSSCHTAENLSCEIAIAEGRIAITSHMEKVTPGRYEVCPADCHLVKVSCGALDPLAVAASTHLAAAVVCFRADRAAATE